MTERPKRPKPEADQVDEADEKFVDEENVPNEEQPPDVTTDDGTAVEEDPGE